MKYVTTAQMTMQCRNCCHTGTAVPDRVKPPFVIFDIRALWLSGLSVRVPACQKLQMAA